MSTITSIAGGDGISPSRTVINTNFANLNTDKIETSVLDTDTALTANSDSKVATQKAVKAYVDGAGFANASTTVKGVSEEATQAQVTAGTTTGETGARLFVNPGTLTSRCPASSAFSGTSPNGYADLDLSSIVGSRAAVVLLKIVCGSTSAEFTFRKNGETGTQPATGKGNAAAKTDILASGEIAYVVVVTDTSGIIEWRTQQAGAGTTSTTTTVTVEAYW